MNCQTCGKPASEFLNKMILEDGYSGEYFCDDECRNKRRARDEELGQDL